MKNLILGSFLVISFAMAALVPTVWAHDEGHGPKLHDTAKYGGVVTSVVLAKDAPLGRQAKLVYKAELTRSQDGTVRVYLYDAQFKALSLDRFEKNVKAILQVKKNNVWQSLSFTLEKQKDSFVGKIPVVARKPFNIDVHLKEGVKELLAAFDNLD